MPGSARRPMLDVCYNRPCRMPWSCPQLYQGAPIQIPQVGVRNGINCIRPRPALATGGPISNMWTGLAGKRDAGEAGDISNSESTEAENSSVMGGAKMSV